MTCPKFSQCINEEHCPLNNMDCLEVKDGRTVSFKEKGKTYLLHINGVKTLKYSIDNHVIKNGVNGVANGCLKCDGLCVVKGNKGRAIFVELKGSDVNHAFDQLRNTIEMLNPFIGKEFINYARVVCAKYPKCYGADPKEKLNRKLQRLNGVSQGMYVSVGSKNKLEERIEDF